MRKGVRVALLSLLVLVSVLYYFSLPAVLFSDPYSTVLQARTGELLLASIAPDGQWRFPESDSVPDKFVKALLTFEDKRFFQHPGVDVRALARSVQQNIQAGEVVSGGSTLTMQVIRLSRKNRSRTVFEKMIEVVLATRLELRYSKREILALYSAHAPFGGNVVGLEAACWRYFGRGMQELSWGEAALLAVLPNAPSLIHPGKNRAHLLTKRNALLDRLVETGMMDAFSCQLAKAEPIPDKPKPLPRFARHLALRAKADGKEGSVVRTSLVYGLQQQVEQLVEEQHRNLAGNQVHNAAAIVIEVSTGEVLAYVGNVSSREGVTHHSEVDILAAPRSTGSILKPFLYAAMLDEGKLLPSTLLPDVPTFINGFAPKNFTKEYDGAVPADKALIRSLNIPAVYLLKEYRYEKFHTLLKQLGMSTLNQPADHYGLSLILGGAEGSLWDIAGMYASMGRVLANFFQHPGERKYQRTDVHEPVYSLPRDSAQASSTQSVLEASSYLSAASIYQTYEVLTNVYRPGEESGWRYFNSSKKIAWKTGTSYGLRDAWAVGTTPEYVVGVWVGNADGEGRPGLTGTDAASPLLFSIFSQLPATSWFKAPTLEMGRVEVCVKSGYKASALCEARDTVRVVKSGVNSPSCPYHQRIHLAADGKHQVNSQCEAIADMKTQTWFVLPPVQEYYYKEKVISYAPLPPMKSGCLESKNTMEMIYPKQNARIFIPRNLSGSTGQTLFQVAHSQQNIRVFWHLDGTYMGSTKGLHQLALQPEKGKHVLTLVDEEGNSLVRLFEVISSL